MDISELDNFFYSCSFSLLKVIHHLISTVPIISIYVNITLPILSLHLPHLFRW